MIVRLSNALFGFVMNAAFRVGYSPQRMRTNFDWLTGCSPTWLRLRHRGLNLSEVELGELKITMIEPSPDPEKTILYLHGGGFFMGSRRAYLKATARLAREARARVALLDYRLAPEHPHPAALEDAVRAYHYLAARVSTSQLIVAGDSAGGGLTMALFLYLRDHAMSLPSKLMCFSPWLDLTGEFARSCSRRLHDKWLDLSHLRAWAPWYLGGNDPRAAYVSPIFGDLRECPPLLVLVGEDEALYCEGMELVNKARAAGVQVDYWAAPQMQHNWWMSLPWLSASRAAYRRMVAFIWS